MWHRLIRHDNDATTTWRVVPTVVHDAALVAGAAAAIVALAAVVVQANPISLAISPLFLLIILGLAWYWRASRRTWAWSLGPEGLTIQQPRGAPQQVPRARILRFAHVPYVPPPSEGHMPEGGFVRVFLVDPEGDLPELGRGLTPAVLSDLERELNGALRVEGDARPTSADPAVTVR